MGATRGESKQADMMRAKGYMPAPEVATRLGHDVTAIYRMIEAGKITGLKVGGRRYVLYSSLVAHLGKDAAKALGLVSEPIEAAKS